MLTAVRSTWALLFGMALMMLANGLQGTLLGVRATYTGFPDWVTGMVMTGYFVGFLLGSYLSPKMMKKVGHIRVFTAWASLASVSALLHAAFVDPYFWAAMRVITGFCYAGLYIVTESWLNDRATNKTRGSLLSIYMGITFASMTGGQLLLSIGDPAEYGLFVLISVLVSLAVIPIALTSRPAPSFTETIPLSLVQLYRISPLGVFGSMMLGAAQGALYGMGAVFAQRRGLPLAHVAIFMACASVGGFLLQWPIGRLSDAMDRRKLIMIITGLAALVPLVLIFTARTDGIVNFVLIGVFGALSLPMYSLLVAHTNDFLEPRQMVSASAALVMISGLGAIVGPSTAGILMTISGPNGFLIFLTVIHSIIGIFAIWRSSIRDAPLAEDHTPHQPVSARSSAVMATLASQEVVENLDDDFTPAGDDSDTAT
ncbi:MAG: MFS family permease [Parasphingorhabdus sp.]|jgi:MFS family permease